MKVAAEVCPVCGGSGWKSSDSDRRVVRCDCRLKSRADSLIASARIPKRYEHCELSNFEFEGPHANLVRPRMAAYRFVEEYAPGRDSTGLLLFGGVGVGKTHLAVGIIKELIITKGIPCLFYDYRELLKQIQNSYNQSVKVTELDVLRPVFDTEVLALDELGAVRPTEWVWDTVSLILNTRYNESRTTIITTNYPDLPTRKTPSDNRSTGREMAEYAAGQETLGDRITDRMRSRLHEMCRVVNIESQTDFRIAYRSASFR
ncbi:MAG: ATP-binding protein [Acidobacteriaceae bacterium]|nr:ATP-binding protein [Acidobacteriaceae bacterium]